MDGSRRAQAVRVVSAVLTVLVALIASNHGARVGAQKPTERLPLSMSRSVWGFDVQGCLPTDEPPPPGTGGFRPIEATTDLVIDGQLVTSHDDLVMWMQPGIGGEGLCRGNRTVSYRVTSADLAAAGVAVPSPGVWSSFDLELRVEQDGVERRVGRVIEFTSGPPIGAFDVVTNSPDGALVRGWAVDPLKGGISELRMTVDGRNWPLQRLPSHTSPPPQPLQILRVLPTPDPLWDERGLGPHHEFEIVAPYGRICLFAERTFDPRHELDAASTPLGCRTTTTDGVQRFVVDSVALTPHPNVHGQNVLIKGRLFDPWRHPYGSPELRAVSPVGGIFHAAIVPSRDRTGPLPGGAGVYDVTIRLDAMGAGQLPVCFDLFGTHEPAWWRSWNPRPDRTPLGCRTITVPPSMSKPPLGRVERVDARGGVVTVSGWAIDHDGGAPRVLLSAGNRLMAVTRTGIPRPDVQGPLGGDGRAGFSSSFTLPPGEHRVCAAWEDTTIGGWSTPDCRQVLVK